MKYLIALTILFTRFSYAGEFHDIEELAHSNGFDPDRRVLLAIVEASHRYHIPAKELTTIGILETGLGKYSKTKLNSNGTMDAGIFQINSVNSLTCIEYNLNSVEGNAYCAAKLLNRIAKKHPDYLGRYHSKTPKHKKAYEKAALKILSVQVINAD